MRRSTSGGAVRDVNYATSPLLASKTPPWRSRFVVALVGLAFALLLGRAVWIQLVGTDFYQQEGAKRFVHKVPMPASRGRILDRHGTVLAASVPVPSIWMIPKDFQAQPAQKQALAAALGLSRAELDERIEAGTKSFAWLKRQVDESVWERVQALDLRGVHALREYRRHYPEGEAAAHVVGFTNIEERGQEGVELRFDAELLGRAGTRSVVRDRFGRFVEDTGDGRPAEDGGDVTLAIDSKIQAFAWQRLRDAVQQHGAKAGSVVVLDALTGEVLALANVPSFHPAKRQNLSGAQLRNRALTDIFEPGSTMKPFIAALAIETGRVTPHTVIQTAPGRIQITGSTITDAHPHGALTVQQVIQKSSNVGTVKLAMPMPAREMWELYAAAGFGQKPQIDFPGAVTGRLRPYKTWRPIEQATMSYGYGLSASLLQIARAYTIFARDGELIPVSMRRVEGHDAATPVSGQRVISAATAREVREMLRMATTEQGTAPRAQAVGYSVGGKTGTARKQVGKAYGSGYRSWFVGFAPAHSPRIVVAVMVDEPSKGQYYGGLVAAPVFSKVVQQALRTLGVPPDIDVKAQIVTQPGTGEAESF
jgi:cell division protein FtsI (penicillin-binding protein 3)